MEHEVNCCGEQEAEPEGEAFDLLLKQSCKPNIWLMGLGNHQKNEIESTSGQNEVFLWKEVFN